MFNKRKRPWKKVAHIYRVELNDGDVKFQAYGGPHAYGDGDKLRRDKLGEFESLASAEDCLDAWWAEFWPKQVKHTRKA